MFTFSLVSIGYVSLRIDEMRPRMLDVGENAEQAANLLNIHEDLMRRLRSKEDQVEELLAKADNLVTQQQEPDVLVYEAMAESLGSAWKELNRQLQMRGYLLKEALKFYEYAQQHERLASRIKSALRSSMNTMSGGDRSNLMRQIQLDVNELIGVTAAAVDSGADIISQIRVLGAMTDNVEQAQETADACLLIEKTMLKMAVEWEQIEESWKNERIKLDAQIEESGAFLAQIDDIEKWLKDARIQLKTGYNTNSLMQQALMLNQLNAMEADMLNANAAMAGELAPLARQKAQVLIDEGRSIVHLDSSISRLVNELEQKLKQIERLAEERIRMASEQFMQELRRLESWLIDIAEPFLASHGRMGSNLIEANEFYTLHKNFASEFIVSFMRTKFA
uniref:Spectrin repeat-containing domain protein n=1 Tax=Ascaris lumbricoides TaxID=6252 RepID=A0A0M3IMF2_ASCLU